MMTRVRCYTTSWDLTPEEVGYAALFLASPLASFITGATLIVSGGIELGFGTKQPFHGLIGDASG